MHLLREDEPKYEVLVIDDNAEIRSLLSRFIEISGNYPREFSDGNSAVNFLKGYDKINQIYNHEKIALIFTDFRMPDGDGHFVLREKNLLNPDIPLYMISGKADRWDTERMQHNHLDGYLEKPASLLSFLRLVNLVLFEKFPLPTEKKFLFSKIGGSTEDAEFFMGSNVRKTILDLHWEYQQKGFQVYLNTGAGKLGDQIKQMRKLYENRLNDLEEPLCPTLTQAISKAQSGILEILADLTVGMINEVGIEKAVSISPNQLTGRAPIQFFEGMDSHEKINMDTIFSQDKMIVMSAAPRHMGIIPYKDTEGRRRYHIVPKMDSDGQSVLLAAALGEEAIFWKRTTGLYSFDILKGYSEKDFDGKSWRQIQKDNVELSGVTFKEIYKGFTEKGIKISTAGSFDGETGHLLENNAAFAAMLKGIRRIDIIPPHPFEFYKHESRHIVTLEKLAYSDEDEMRRSIFQSALEKKNQHYICGSKYNQASW